MKTKTPSRTRIDCTGNPRKAELYAHWAVNHLNAISSVLDIGAGDGAAADVFPKSTAYSALDIGADIYPRADRVRYFESFPALRNAITDHEEVDLVLLFDVLEHTNDFLTLFCDGLKRASQSIFVSLPNEMNLELRVRFLLGQPIPAHGLSLISAKPGHKHQWFITYQEAKAVLTEAASDFGFELAHEVLIRNLPATWWKRLVVRLLSLPFSDETISHGFGFVFQKSH